MAKWPLLVLTVALAGCYQPYRRPTLSPGGDVAIPQKATPAEAVIGAVLCSKGITQDTSSVALTKPCDPLRRADTTIAPGTLPKRKP
jgi:hypothetical protein